MWSWDLVATGLDTIRKSSLKRGGCRGALPQGKRVRFFEWSFCGLYLCLKKVAQTQANNNESEQLELKSGQAEKSVGYLPKNS